MHHGWHWHRVLLYARKRITLALWHLSPVSWVRYKHAITCPIQSQGSPRILPRKGTHVHTVQYARVPCCVDSTSTPFSRYRAIHGTLVSWYCNWFLSYGTAHTCCGPSMPFSERSIAYWNASASGALISHLHTIGIVMPLAHARTQPFTRQFNWSVNFCFSSTMRATGSMPMLCDSCTDKAPASFPQHQLPKSGEHRRRPQIPPFTIHQLLIKGPIIG
ncbi:hypothetical protein DFH94DRAFT_94082 [Russula ochroleuca]|uniref:Uncharacterized protein n=1 Tax=Russula ochroleuca TaxID=152965 RepID=A0A9P5T6N8_9AGAM|nr:hypothetical protein DFH94DRAFT_94082 [Russula ochroleuca]